MSGKKGAKWSPEKRRPEMKKCNIRLSLEDYSLAKNLAMACRTSLSKLLEECIKKQMHETFHGKNKINML